jgi:penicillin-binding protein 1A
MTWHGIMEYAHQGIELKPLPGIPAPAPRKDMVVAENKKKPDANAPPPRPALLTKKGADVLVRVEHMMDEASRALGVSPAASGEERKRGASVESPLVTELENVGASKN